MAELRKEDLWVMADKLRNNMDSAEYKHVCLGLIFLKYISDSLKELIKKFLKMNTPTQKIEMNILQKMCFGCRRKHVGKQLKTVLKIQQLVRLSIMPCM